MFDIIACVDESYGLGKNNGLPWSFQEDFDWFKRHTQRGPFVVGKRTWDSMPDSAKARLSKFTVSVIGEVVGELPSCSMVLGGGYTYRKILENYQVRRIILTKVYGEFGCDTFFPKEYLHWYTPVKYFAECHCVDRISHRPYDLDFTIYHRKDLV